MLDCDASFVSVPEFASIRRSLPARLMAATALAQGPDRAAETDAETADAAAFRAPFFRTERQMAESFTSAPPAFVDHLPSSDLPPAPAVAPAVAAAIAYDLPAMPPLADLRAEAAAAEARAEEPAVAPEAEAEARPVTPRRPLRFTSARATEEATPVALPSFSLFDGVFDDDSLDGPGVDPRLLRSRARARAHIAAMEAALTPEQRNLWHDDPVSAPNAAMTEAAQPAPQPEPAPAPTRAEAPARRHARHLTLAEITTRTSRHTPAIHDPLRDRLHDLRHILYTPTPEEEEAAAETAARAAAEPKRSALPAAARSFALQIVALMLGLLVTALQALKSAARARPARQVQAPQDQANAAATAFRPTITARLPAPLARLLPRLRMGFAPRLAAAATALAGLAIPLAALVPGGVPPLL